MAAETFYEGYVRELEKMGRSFNQLMTEPELGLEYLQDALRNATVISGKDRKLLLSLPDTKVCDSSTARLIARHGILPRFISSAPYAIALLFGRAERREILTYPFRLDTVSGVKNFDGSDFEHEISVERLLEEIRITSAIAAQSLGNKFWSAVLPDCTFGRKIYPPEDVVRFLFDWLFELSKTRERLFPYHITSWDGRNMLVLQDDDETELDIVDRLNPF